ncbi:MAG: hypothetical protein RSE14_04340 [Erythrobacter sp.]|jgi:hypothetical protein|uniref:hypothetical protein n=1 Tax=Erythrobacter sp. TaxID=1042 RepID=UPI002B489645|nr:hypothetical protein [Erythrobacter sp.]WRH71333.1 MAG: hypothetical protein RSE14_04340 [Erythrobacter sp.]
MFYLHIPKTGGQTLARRIASAFPPGRAHLQAGQFTYPDDCERLAVCLSGHDFVEAHVTGELLAARPLRDLLVTVREPVAQIISNFRHIRREPERRLSRAARELDPGTFLDHFGDFFTDFQSRYLLSAFMPLGLAEERAGFWPLAAKHLPKVLEQVRWLVPTDRIDAFVPLWEAETGRQAAERSYATNHAPDDGVDLPALEAAIRARPALFALDNVLYQYAQSRFAAWAVQVQQQTAPWDYPANAARVFHAGGGGVWLRRGWYPSEATCHGAGNWAGPARRSDISLRRGAGQEVLAFDVTVINGITHDGITAHDARSFAPLPLRHEEIAPDLRRYRIDISALPDVCEIALMVPDCYAAINVFPAGESGDLERRSFLATGWQLAPAESPKARKTIPAEAASEAPPPIEPAAEAIPAE